MAMLSWSSPTRETSLQKWQKLEIIVSIAAVTRMLMLKSQLGHLSMEQAIIIIQQAIEVTFPIWTSAGSILNIRDRRTLRLATMRCPKTRWASNWMDLWTSEPTLRSATKIGSSSTNSVLMVTPISVALTVMRLIFDGLSILVHLVNKKHHYHINTIL